MFMTVVNITSLSLPITHMHARTHTHTHAQRCSKGKIATNASCFFFFFFFRQSSKYFYDCCEHNKPLSPHHTQACTHRPTQMHTMLFQYLQLGFRSNGETQFPALYSKSFKLCRLIVLCVVAVGLTLIDHRHQFAFYPCFYQTEFNLCDCQYVTHIM